MIVVGSKVKVVQIIDAEGDHLLDRIGEVGIVTAVRLTHPFAGSLLVKLENGVEEMFWIEELEELEEAKE